MDNVQNNVAEGLDKSEKTKEIKILVLHFVVFFISWFIVRLFALPYIEGILGKASIIYAFIECIVKVMIYVIPVYIILKKQGFNPITYIKLNNKVKMGLILGTAFGIAIMAFNYYKSKGLNANITFYDMLNIFIVAGITEEILFRGFIMQKIKRLLGFWPANIITTLLFTSVHIPILIYGGQISALRFAQIGILSLIYGYAYEETDSLVCPIVLHCLWDLSTFLFVYR